MARKYQLILLLAVTINSFLEVTGTKYCITPNVSQTVETENCSSSLTLSLFSEKHNLDNTNLSLITEPIELIFLPGDHYLNISLFFFPVSFTINLTGINSSKHICPTILCTPTQLVLNILYEVELKNLYFSNCYVNILPYYSLPLNVIFGLPESYFNKFIQKTVSLITDCSFNNLTVNNAPALSIIHLPVDFNGIIAVKNNDAHDFSALILGQTVASFSGILSFCNNTGNFYMYNSTVNLTGNALLSSNNNTGGSAMQCVNSTVFFNGNTVFEHNSANTFSCLQGTKESIFSVHGNLRFYNNTASFIGAGLGLLSGSRILLDQGANVVFHQNIAKVYGGAIYIEDEEICTASVSPPCFFQVPELEPQVNLTFINNSADEGGSDVFGGKLNECLIRGGKNGREVFDQISSSYSHFNSPSDISSDAVQLCICDGDMPTCNRITYNLTAPSLPDYNATIYPGQNLTIRLAALGQRQGIVSAPIRYLRDVDPIKKFYAALDVQHILTAVEPRCTFRTFSLTSTQLKETLFFIPGQGICVGRYIPLIIHVDFKQYCPPGFENDPIQGACVCDKHLKLTRNVVICDINDQTFQHQGELWIGFDNSSNDLILHNSPCPFDYCHTNGVVEFTLENTDKQCRHNRSNLLCGACQQKLSVLLGGTSRCKMCTNASLAFLLVFAIAGIALVMFLFILELYVSIGTLNGLIFFANIVQINRSHYFTSNNLLSVFIAWLNLDLGIETCFYDGMDTYGKTWLQFVFPFYIWALVIIIIFIGQYSMKVTRVLGPHPIALLATLFHLSYVKLLRAVISAVTWTTLSYTNDRIIIQWALDANIDYFGPRHIPLLLFALLVLILLILPYTLLLVLGQWIQAKSHWKMLCWAKSPRLKVFLDVYHAPYKDNHRYWPGLLLLLSVGLALATSYSGDSLEVATFSVILVVLLVQLWGSSVGGVYKKWPLNLLEGYFLVNLGLFTFTTYNNEKLRNPETNKNITTKVFVGISMIAFSFIVLYHILIIRLKHKLVFWFFLLKNIITKNEESNEGERNDEVEGDISEAPTTVSYVALRELLLSDDAI